MVPDNHGSLVVTSVCLQSVALMVVVSLWVMAWQLHIKGGGALFGYVTPRNGIYNCDSGRLTRTTYDS